MPGKHDQLTEKQLAFLAEYLTNGRNATAAYRVAYEPNGSEASINVRACELLKNDKIAVRLAEADKHRQHALKQAETAIAVTQERISRELARLAFSDARTFFDWTEKGVKVKSSAELTDDQAAAIVEVSQTVTEGGGTIRVRLADKRAALMDLAKLHGYVIEKRENRNIDLRDMTDEQLKQLVAQAEAEREKDGAKH